MNKRIFRLIGMAVLGLCVAAFVSMVSPGTVMATVSGDNIAPRILGILIDGADFVNGYGKEAEVTVSACDAQSGIDEHGYSCAGPFRDENQDIDCDAMEYGNNSFRITENGTYYFAVRDVAGNTSVTCSEINCIDREGPVRKDITSHIPGAVNGYGKSVVLTVVAEDDGAGLAEEAFSFDGGENFTASPENAFYENTEEVFVYRDALGNESSDEVVIQCIDNQSPAIRSVSESPLNAQNGYGLSAVLSVDAADTKSGLAYKAYSFDDGKTYVSENRALFEKNGVCIIRVRDGLGNETRRAASVSTIDRCGPSLVITGNPKEKVNANVTLNVSISDSEAGLASLWYQNDAVKSKTLIKQYGGGKRGKEKVTITKNGYYTFFAYDRLGNETEKTVMVSKIDRTYRTSSSSIRVTSQIGTSRSSSTKGEKSVTIGGGTSASSSSSRKTVVIGGESEREVNNDEYWDESEEGGRTLFVGVSDNSVEDDGPENEDVYVPDTDILTGELEQALAESPVGEVKYPEEIEDEGPTRGQIIAMGIGIVVGLLALLMLILWKLGIITPSRLIRGDAQEVTDGGFSDMSDILSDDDTTSAL